MTDYMFTVIVPVYNEAENLLRVEQVLLSYVKTALVPTKIIFVNDGSVDESQSIIEEICHRNSFFSNIAFDRNYGLTTALKAGFDAVDTELVGYLDADLQTSPEDFNLLLKHIGEYDLVTGMRAVRKDTLTKRITSKTANCIRNLFTHDGMNDTGCPLKVIKTSYAKKIPMFKGLHRFLPAMILLQGGKIKQVSVRHFPRTAGQAKFGFRNRLFGPLVDCFAYLWMKKRYVHYTVLKADDNI